MNIALDGNNFFHTGWLARFCGLPRQNPVADALKDGQVKDFEDGWDTCDETEDPRLLGQAFAQMLRQGQVVAHWQDDEGNKVAGV